MIELGKIQKLKADRASDHGLYLIDETEPSGNATGKIESVLLPKLQAKKIKVGDYVEVFVYKDSEDRPVATCDTPLITLSHVARLKVKEITKIGAFLDWGMPKDLFLPFKEQTKRLEAGEEVLVALYTDKSDRLCATMKIYHYLETGAPYEKDDRVNGTVYEVSGNFGTFVAVDDKYSALIPKNELFYPIPIGAKISCRVVKKTEDGKLTLSAREKTAVQMDADARLVYLTLRSAGGFLPFHDKSSPEDIKARFGLSKAAFKRAIGALYKARKITISEKGISDAGDDSEV
ncbi:MAG: RNA-binding protein [Lachnospiraceae bacterium]|nr:RNA-binding protein [Lachnospiraceae bacterium]